jgi:peptide/nickel transport system permease protein
MFLLTGSLAMMNDGLRDAFDPSSSSIGSAKKRASGKGRTGRNQKNATTGKTQEKAS